VKQGQIRCSVLVSAAVQHSRLFVTGPVIAVRFAADVARGERISHSTYGECFSLPGLFYSEGNRV
jgi:hypothetical protein